MQATEQGAQQTCNSRDIKPPPQMGKTSSGNSKAQASRKVKAMAGISAAWLGIRYIAREKPGKKAKAATDPPVAARAEKTEGIFPGKLMPGDCGPGRIPAGSGRWAQGSAGRPLG